MRAQVFNFTQNLISIVYEANQKDIFAILIGGISMDLEIVKYEVWNQLSGNLQFCGWNSKRDLLANQKQTWGNVRNTSIKKLNIVMAQPSHIPVWYDKNLDSAVLRSELKLE